VCVSSVVGDVPAPQTTFLCECVCVCEYVVRHLDTPLSSGGVRQRVCVKNLVGRVFVMVRSCVWRM